MPEQIATLGAKLYKTAIADANEIGNIIAIGEIDFTRPNIDTTVHSDTWRTKLPGLWDAGEITARIAFDPQDADHIALWTTDVGSAGPHTAIATWFITVKSNAAGTKKMSFQFTAFVDSFRSEGYEVEGLQVFSVKFQLSGTVTITPDDATNPSA